MVLPISLRWLCVHFSRSCACLFGLWWFVFAVSILTCSSAEPQRQSEPTLSSPSPLFKQPEEIKTPGLTTHELNLSLGVGLGMEILGTRERHNWWFGTVQYGWPLDGMNGKEQWYHGRWELLAQLFGGVQYRPSRAYFIGTGPLLRYNFATGHRLVPFVNAGAGFTATDIRDGDLSTTFEFNLQVGGGIRWFLRDNLALTAQYLFVHLSNASMDSPNLGVNNSTFLGGVSFFF
jgi:hypothetical protein